MLDQDIMDAKQVTMFEQLTLCRSISLSVSEKEYCEMETFTAKCWENEVIMMQSALYGRMKIGKCVKLDFGFMGCKAGKYKASELQIIIFSFQHHWRSFVTWKLSKASVGMMK